MFTFRIHMLYPSAEFVNIGRIDNYRVDFIRYSQFWGGPTETLVPTANAHTWGVIWRIHHDDKDKFDVQESVDTIKYYLKCLPVNTTHMGAIQCRCYIQTSNPLPRGDNDPIPIERWPSWALKEIMIYGAKEHHLPDYYVKYLKRLNHNGEEGALRTWCLLDVYAREKPCTCGIATMTDKEALKHENKLIGDFKWHTEIIVME